MLNNKDVAFLSQKNITAEQVEQQLLQFNIGIQRLEIVKPVTHRDGIRQLNEKRLNECVKLFEKKSKKLSKTKFVPASGAATRMFRSLYEILNTYKGSEEDYLRIMAEKGFNSVNYMCSHLKNFAFYPDLTDVLEKQNITIDEISKKKDLPLLLQYLLTEKGLNYGNLPKGLLKFHRTGDSPRTPFEEHLVEAIEYARTRNKVCLHLTVSPNHYELFQELSEKLIKKYKDNTGLTFDITFSVQKPETDTITVDADNQPLHDNEGNLVFRPGGHGALIYNLNELDADLIFIKNIDNVVQERLKHDTVYYKKVLAGYLIETREEAAYLYKKLGSRAKKSVLAKTEDFITKKLHIVLPENSTTWNLEQKRQYFINILDRPYRVCGMVRNEGEPGGGPFWVKDADGSLSLQIVEGSQFAADQKPLMQKATHFNPVDLVCCIKDFKGRKYDLTSFIDQTTGFISMKSLDGKQIKALELPGLWNGSMAFWNTLCVEVPPSTFNPVKTVNDLLRAEHLYEKDLLSQAEDTKLI